MKRKLILGVTLFLMLLTLFALSINAAETIESWDISATSSDNVTATLYSDYSLVISGSGNMENWTSYSNVPWYSPYSRKIKSVTIENGVTNIGNRAFGDCYVLTSVVIPDSVATIGYSAFDSCDALTSMVIPDSVTSIGNDAFYHCDALTSVVIGVSVTTIGDYAFYYCRALTSVKLPDSVTTIGNRAFADCDALTSIVIPDSVKTIGKYAFRNCTALTSVVIGDSVTTIGNYAFENCDVLKIYCEAVSKPSGWSSYWNYSNRPVVWGYFDKEASLGEIFTFLGYSFNEEGSMAVGFEINYEALKKYEEKTGETLEIGVVFAAYDLLLGNQPLDNEGNAIALDDGAVVKFDLTEYDYTYYDFVITDIVDSIKDIDLVISAYINNGYENKYVQENGIADTVTGISYNEAKA